MENSYKIQWVMANSGVITNLKASTIAIGIIDENNPMFPLAIGGTGFFISEDGFFVTAFHVLEDLDYLLNERFKKIQMQK